MKWLWLLLPACTSQQQQAAYLPSDASFVRDDVPQCLAENPDNAQFGYPCCQLLSFYSDGGAWKTSGEEGFRGTYTLDGPVARGEIFGQDFVFDFSTNTATGDLVAGHWLPDTDNLTAVACR